MCFLRTLRITPCCVASLGRDQDHQLPPIQHVWLTIKPTQTKQPYQVRIPATVRKDQIGGALALHAPCSRVKVMPTKGCVQLFGINHAAQFCNGSFLNGG